MELASVQVEEHVAQLILHDVEGVHATRVARHRDKGVARRGAESPWRVLGEVRSLVGSSFRHKLMEKKVIWKKTFFQIGRYQKNYIAVIAKVSEN